LILTLILTYWPH